MEPAILNPSSPSSSSSLNMVSARPFVGKKLLSPSPKCGSKNGSGTKRFSSSFSKVKASILRKDGGGHDRNYGGRLVDENMIVLRKRIQEMKMEEMDYEAPSDKWMKWERLYYANRYHWDVCDAVGLLQSMLINSRPSLALGMLALLFFSVPTSLALLVFQALEAARWLLPQIHL